MKPFDGHHATGKHFGKHRGEVTGVDDDGHQGTITVKIPTLLGTEATVRARACMPYGHFFVPPVGAQVWIEFEEGNLDLPLWVGAWYAEGEVPPEARVSPPDHRVVRTPAGHTIEIVDHAGEERILIRHSSDAFVSIDEHGSILLSNPNGSHLFLDAENSKTTLVEQHGNHLTMSENGTSIVNPKGTLLDVTGDTVNIAAPKVVVQSQSVALGAGASEPTIMGTAFKVLWDMVRTHIHATPTGPSLTPQTPAGVPLPPLTDGVHLTSEVLVK